MSQQTRAQLKALKNNKVLSGGNQTTAQNLRDMFDGIIDSMVDILDDKDQNGGYLGIDTLGHVNISKVSSASPVGFFLRDDGTWQAITMPTPITETTYKINGTGTIDLNLLAGEVILDLIDAGPQILNKIINFNNVKKLTLRPIADLTINDGSVSSFISIKLFAPTLFIPATKFGFLEMTKRNDGSQDQFFQTNFIDQYT